MAYKLINQEYCPFSNNYRREYLCDTDADFDNLPDACVGSTAVSVETGNVLVVNTSGDWVAFAEV